MRDSKIKKFIQQHPEVFSHSQEYSPFISDMDIPDISWFYKRNQHLLEPHMKAYQKATKPWYLYKRFLVPVCTALVLGVFLSSTVPGRAIAEKIYNTVINMSSGQFSIQHGGENTISDLAPSNTGSPKPNLPPTIAEYAALDSSIPDKINMPGTENFFYSSIDQANLAHGLSIAKSSVGDIPYVRVSVGDDMFMTASVYLISGMDPIWVHQQIYSGDFSSAYVSTPDMELFETLDGVTIYGNHLDGVGHAFILKDNTSVSIFAKDITHEAFVSFLENFQLIPY